MVEDAGVGKTRFAGEAMGRGLDPAAARLSARLTPGQCAPANPNDQAVEPRQCGKRV